MHARWLALVLLFLIAPLALGKEDYSNVIPVKGTTPEQVDSILNPSPHYPNASQEIYKKPKQSDDPNNQLKNDSTTSE